MNTVALSPETFEQAIRIMSTQAFPAIRLLEGYKGGLILGDAQTGKAVFITFWATEDDMRRSEDEAGAIRDDSAEALGIEGIAVERYAVRLHDPPA